MARLRWIFGRGRVQKRAARKCAAPVQAEGPAGDIIKEVKRHPTTETGEKRRVKAAWRAAESQEGS